MIGMDEGEELCEGWAVIDEGWRWIEILSWERVKVNPVGEWLNGVECETD